MAEIVPTVEYIEGVAITVVWESLGNGDVGAPVDISQWASRTVWLEGTLTNANLNMEGSNIENPSSWQLLTSNQNSIPPNFGRMGSLNPEVFELPVNPRYVRPKVQGSATGTMSVYIHCVGRL